MDVDICKCTKATQWTMVHW